jgi:hypothetical protein
MGAVADPDPAPPNPAIVPAKLCDSSSCSVPVFPVNVTASAEADAISDVEPLGTVTAGAGGPTIWVCSFEGHNG